MAHTFNTLAIGQGACLLCKVQIGNSGSFARNVQNMVPCRVETYNVLCSCARSIAIMAMHDPVVIVSQLEAVPIYGKMAGAVGNYNAHISAYPNVHWDTVADHFVSGLGLELNPYVTQV